MEKTSGTAHLITPAFHLAPIQRSTKEKVLGEPSPNTSAFKIDFIE